MIKKDNLSWMNKNLKEDLIFHIKMYKINPFSIKKIKEKKVNNI